MTFITEHPWMTFCLILFILIMIDVHLGNFFTLKFKQSKEKK